jgi:hypothetical protein
MVFHKAQKRGSRIIINGLIWHIKESPDHIVSYLNNSGQGILELTGQDDIPLWVRPQAISGVSESYYYE